MNFSKALKLLKQGKRLRRKGWNGKGIFIKLRKATANSDMSHDFIYIDTTGLQTDNQGAPKDRVPWLASQTDMLADDWEVASNQYLNRFSADEYLLDAGDKARAELGLSFDEAVSSAYCYGKAIRRQGWIKRYWSLKDVPSFRNGCFDMYDRRLVETFVNDRVVDEKEIVVTRAERDATDWEAIDIE